MHAKAVVQRGQDLVEEQAELPALDPLGLLVRVRVAAFNPTDKLAFDLNAFGDGAVLGCDFAGVVEAVGDGVTKFSVGDKVAAFVWGGEIHGLGAYSELCIADERIAFKVPESITLEQAATLPLVASTAYLALFSKDCLNLRQNQGIANPLLILGGSTSVGSLALQIAAIHGIDTVTTASQRNFKVTQQDGAKETFDYNDAGVTRQIEQRFPSIDVVFDTVGSPESTKTVAKVLQSRKSKLCTVRPGKVHTESMPDNVQVSDVFVFTAFLKEHSYRGKAHWPVNPGNHALVAELFTQLPDLLSSGKIKPRPVRSMGSLSAASVRKAIELTRAGTVSNEKLTFTVSEA